MVSDILSRLEALGSAENVAGMRRFGITAQKAFGVASPDLKKIAREIRSSGADRHEAALALWDTGVHEARCLAYLVDDPKRVTAGQMDAWVADLDNWAICDSTCGHLFSYTPLAYEKADEWMGREEEFVKRAGIVLIAWLTVHDKKADDSRFTQFLPKLENVSTDERNFVKKAVSWSLRQIGKRSSALHEQAVESALRIQAQNTPSARWIAADALRELRSEAVLKRLSEREAAKR